MALNKPGRAWREQGEEYATRASGSMPEFGTYYGLLAVYCEVRHASGDDRAVEGTPRGSRDGRLPEFGWVVARCGSPRPPSPWAVAAA